MLQLSERRLLSAAACGRDNAKGRDPPVLRSQALTARPAVILAAFTAAVFTSALLLFAVQPMFARMVLPRLGGSPSVWSVAMVFFQSMLLAGYAYAHVLMRVKRPAVVVAIHLSLLITAGLTLPLSIAESLGDPLSAWAELWLMALFALSIGLPFFALSANNPLLQAWFVRSGHSDGSDPYFLYAASNIGSFLALLAYPAILEPVLTLRQQNLVWSVGFWFLFALIALCGYLMLRSPLHAGWTERADERATSAPTWPSIGRWIFLSAVPSGLLVAVTAHISTDIAAAPLLWVVPLSLYLLTWVLVFQSKPLLNHRLMLAIQPFAIAGLVVMLVLGGTPYMPLNLALHLLAFFVIAMASHGELAGQRPPARHLTTFYLSLSAGGMVGGLFAGLIAPHAFSWVAEYPILIALAAFCRPLRPLSWNLPDRLFWIAAIVIVPAILAPALLFGWAPPDATARAVPSVLVAIAGASLLVALDAWKFALVVALGLALIRLYPVDERRLETVRSFFGVHKIYDTAEGRFRVLEHGTTVHGAQRIRDEEGRPVQGRPEPLAYYHADSPLAEAIHAVRARKGAPLRAAVVGLGAGSLSCYVEPGETWQFFEIDPTVVAIARDPARFSFVSSCAPDIPIVIGDARLTLAREPDRHYDLIIVDAYSSDSIPVHLATREAMAVYKSKLAPGGAVLMHISNRHLELASVVTGIAGANGLQTWVSNDFDDAERDDEYVFTSQVAISAAKEADIGELNTLEHWILQQPNPAIWTWTDDYSNILGAIWRHFD
jgi:hypothetical protein